MQDLRLVRDKFTHVSRGFAFVHFYSVRVLLVVIEAIKYLSMEQSITSSSHLSFWAPWKVYMNIYFEKFV